MWWEAGDYLGKPRGGRSNATYTRVTRVCEFPPAYLLLVTYRYRRSSECPVPECAKCEIREIKVQTRTKPDRSRGSTSQTRNSLFNWQYICAPACARWNPRRTRACGRVFVLWSLSVERRFVLRYRTLPASPAPHQLQLPYRNTRVVSSARGEVSHCAACRCVLSWGPCCRESRVSCDSRARVAFRRSVVCVVCTPIEYTLHRASSTGRAGWYARRRRGGARHAQAAVVPW